VHGDEWRLAAQGEEPGLAYFVPEIVRFTHADLDHAIDILLLVLLASCFASGTAGMFFWLQNTPCRIAATIGLGGILVATSLVGDIYMAKSAIVIALIPWAMYFSRQQKIGAGALVFGFFAGLGASLANLTRVHAGTPVLLFLAVLLFAFRVSVRKRVLVAVLVIAGFTVPMAYFQVLVSRRDSVLEKIFPGYQPVVSHHPFWHTVYCGLGYLNNDYGLKSSFHQTRGRIPITGVREHPPHRSFPVRQKSPQVHLRDFCRQERAAIHNPAGLLEPRFAVGAVVQETVGGRGRLLVSVCVYCNAGIAGLSESGLSAWVYGVRRTL